MKENKYLPILGATAAIAVIYFLFFRKKRSEVLEQQALLQEGSSTTPTYPNSQYFAWANRLEQSMFDIGTDEDAIFSVFSYLRNNGDFIKLKQAFGVREYTGGFLPGFLSPDLSLDGWIQEELDSSEIQQLNNILKNKGITYRF